MQESFDVSALSAIRILFHAFSIYLEWISFRIRFNFHLITEHFRFRFPR